MGPGYRGHPSRELLLMFCETGLWSKWVEDLRLTMNPWLSGIRTMGLTPQAAIAGTASCMAASK